MVAPIPFRAEEHYRVRLMPALMAGTVAALICLAFYYSTLGLLPTASFYPATTYPVSAWAHRFDLAQWLGTIPFPPIPTWWTWWVGLAIWFGTLASMGVAYAILLAWALQTSNSIKGVGFASALFFTLAFGLTLAQGYHPAVMRNALPDVGVFLLGWSFVGAVQLLLTYLLYGAVLGALYRRFAVRH